MNEENKELTPEEKLKLKKAETDLAEKEKREELKLQSKLEKEQLKKEKREALAQENIKKISQSYKSDENSSLYFDKTENKTETYKKEENKKDSQILDSSQIGSIAAGSVGYKATKTKSKKKKDGIFDLDEKEEEIKLSKALDKKSFYIQGDEEELTPEQKLKIKKEEQNLLEAEERDKKKKQLKLEKEEKRRERLKAKNEEFIKSISGEKKDKETGFIKEDDDRIVLEGETEIGSIRDDIILPDTGGSIKSKNPLNYTEEDEEEDNKLANTIMDEHKRESKILNYNEEEENDETKHFKTKAPIVIAGKELIKKEREVANDLEEQGKINDYKKWEEEKASNMPEEIIESPNMRESSKKGLSPEDLKKKELEIKALMERLAPETIEKYLYKIYAKKNKTIIDKLKIKVGENILSTSF
jgi:hypothetical protein